MLVFAKTRVMCGGVRGDDLRGDDIPPPHHVCEYDNACASYSELVPIQYRGYSLNNQFYLFLFTYLFRPE